MPKLAPVLVCQLNRLGILVGFLVVFVLITVSSVLASVVFVGLFGMLMVGLCVLAALWKKVF
jgi:hypothetical protein